MDNVPDTSPSKIKAIITTVRPVYVVLVVIFCVVAFFLYFFISRYFQQNKGTVVEKSVTATSTLSISPSKKEHLPSLPPSFPSTIPVEKNLTLSQSYELNYEKQKQSTVVFISSKTVAQNYTLYLSTLKQQGWVIAKEYSKPNVSFIYARKDGDEINVTVSEGVSSGSEVSISILKL
jgi:hypothetical protein